MGEEAYHKAQEELWDDFDARSRAYSDAVKALRGEGVDKAMTPALLGYSTKTVSKLLGGEAAANVVYSPANLYLALSMLTETVDGETRAQLLDLLGAEDEETVCTTANAIWRSLYTDSANSKTLLANSLWLSEGQAYKTETVERAGERLLRLRVQRPHGHRRHQQSRAGMAEHQHRRPARGRGEEHRDEAADRDAAALRALLQGPLER